MRCFLYSSFSADPSGGNLAGIVIQDRSLPDDVLQAIAKDLNAPTTGFVQFHNGEPNRYAVRFFSPTAEMDMCGHVTLGIACALLDEQQVQPGRIVQATAAGEIEVHVERMGSSLRAGMTLRLPQFDASPASLDELKQLLGVRRADLLDEVVPGIASTGLRHLFVGLRHVEALASMRRDDAALLQFCDLHGIDTIGVFACAREGDFSWVQLRDLCHGIGNPEESASGTTNGALACFLWSRGLLRAKADSVILRSSQGVEMGRPSAIEVVLTMSAGAIQEVRVGGSAVRVLARDLVVPV